MAESEDRTQAPSKLRKQQARERGQVAHSPELTGAVALLAGSLLLGICGEGLAAGLLTLLRNPWMNDLPISLDIATATAQFRGAASEVLGPLILLFLGLAAAGVVAHQAQVGGLWAPNLFAPNPGRLWTVGSGQGLASRAKRGAWILGKTTVIGIVAIWAISMRVDDFSKLSRLPVNAMARGWCDLVRGLLVTMAIAAAVLGLIDYMLGRMRFDDLMRLTPDEAREDQKAMDGDPALKGRRRRLAQALRGDSPELMRGAKLVVTGANGLTVILASGPAPQPVKVLSSANGPTGLTLRRTAQAARVTMVEQPELAISLARISTRQGAVLTAEILQELTAIWPAS